MYFRSRCFINQNIKPESRRGQNRFSRIRANFKKQKKLEEIDEFAEHLDEIIEGGASSKKVFSIWKINLQEGKMNCAIAVDKTLAGFPTTALPKSPFKIGEKSMYLNLPNPDSADLQSVPIKLKHSHNRSAFTNDFVNMTKILAQVICSIDKIQKNFK